MVFGIHLLLSSSFRFHKVIEVEFFEIHDSLLCLIQDPHLAARCAIGVVWLRFELLFCWLFLPHGILNRLLNEVDTALLFLQLLQTRITLPILALFKRSKIFIDYVLYVSKHFRVIIIAQVVIWRKVEPHHLIEVYVVFWLL